tara:strand:+ start:124 stop:786 length:663 start_codon:yes stop_codon:yes gene_type:complete
MSKWVKAILHLMLSQITLQSGDNTTTPAPSAVINTDINEHKYVITQVILNKDFDNTLMTKVSDWSDNFESDIANELNIGTNEIDVIGTWDSTDDDVPDVIVDFLIYGDNPTTLVNTLKDKVDQGLYLTKVDADAYGITVNDKTIYDKSRWQRAKDYANDKWDTFQNAEMSAPIVTAWVLGLGIPFCICMSYVLYKCKDKQNKMVDEGVVTVKLNTVKTTI